MKDYETLLKNAPAQDSPEFIEYLRKNNVVVADSSGWLVIENAKYHGREGDWLTAFAITPGASLDSLAAVCRLHGWGDWQWLKKAVNKQSVPGRFHIHLIKVDK